MKRLNLWARGSCQYSRRESGTFLGIFGFVSASQNPPPSSNTRCSPCQVTLVTVQQQSSLAGCAGGQSCFNGGKKTIYFKIPRRRLKGKKKKRESKLVRLRSARPLRTTCDASGSGWLATSTQTNSEGKPCCGWNVYHNKSTIASKCRKAIVCPGHNDLCGCLRDDSGKNLLKNPLISSGMFFMG